MTDEQMLKILRQIDLFERFKEETLLDLMRTCRTVTLQPDHVLFEYGSPGDTMYVILEGYLQVYRNQRVIATVGPNECIGEMALVESQPRSASARAMGVVQLLEVSGDLFDRCLRTDAAALAVMMRTISRRLRRTIDETHASYEEVNMLVHDMLNLATIFQAAEIVMNSVSEDDPNHDFLQSILKAQHSLEVMMRSALRRARGLSAPYQKEAVDLEQLLRECLQRDLAMHQGVQRARVRLETVAPLGPLRCNVVDIKRVIFNLVINAVQALGEEGGEVVIHAEQKDGRTFIHVSDNGCGIPSAVQRHIFEPHFTTKSEGNGLGLSSCREIVERLHEGRLTFESIEGEGTTFVCELPGEG